MHPLLIYTYVNFFVTRNIEMEKKREMAINIQHKNIEIFFLFD